MAPGVTALSLRRNETPPFSLSKSGVMWTGRLGQVFPKAGGPAVARPNERIRRVRRVVAWDPLRAPALLPSLNAPVPTLHLAGPHCPRLTHSPARRGGGQRLAPFFSQRTSRSPGVCPSSEDPGFINNSRQGKQTQSRVAFIPTVNQYVGKLPLVRPPSLLSLDERGGLA